MNLLSLPFKIVSISAAIYLLILSFHKWQSTSAQGKVDETSDNSRMLISKPVFFISGETKIKYGINEVIYKCNLYNPNWEYSWEVDNGLNNYKAEKDQLKIFSPPVGDYEIKLTVTNENGISETEFLQIRVLDQLNW